MAPSRSLSPGVLLRNVSGMRVGLDQGPNWPPERIRQKQAKPKDHGCLSRCPLHCHAQPSAPPGSHTESVHLEEAELGKASMTSADPLGHKALDRTVGQRSLSSPGHQITHTGQDPQELLQPLNGCNQWLQASPPRAWATPGASSLAPTPWRVRAQDQKDGPASIRAHTHLLHLGLLCLGVLLRLLGQLLQLLCCELR